MPRRKLFRFDILTPNGTIFSEKVFHVSAPGQHGRFGVLVNHIPSIILLGRGQVIVQALEKNRSFAIDGGVAHIQNNIMKIVTEAARDVSAVDGTR